MPPSTWSNSHPQQEPRLSTVTWGSGPSKSRATLSTGAPTRYCCQSNSPFRWRLSPLTQFTTAKVWSHVGSHSWPVVTQLHLGQCFPQPQMTTSTTTMQLIDHIPAVLLWCTNCQRIDFPSSDSHLRLNNRLRTSNDPTQTTGSCWSWKCARPQPNLANRFHFPSTRSAT